MKNLSYMNNFFLNLIHNNNQILYKIINFLILTLSLFFLIMLYPHNSLVNINEGDILKADIIADTNIKYKNNDATEKKIKSIKTTTPPTYIHNVKIVKERKNLITDFFKKIFVHQNFNEATKLAEKLEINFTDEIFKTLQKTNSKYSNLSNNIINIYTEIMNEGVTQISKSKIPNLKLSGIEIEKYEEDKLIKTHFAIDEIITITKTSPIIEKKVETTFTKLKSPYKKTVINLLKQLITPNIIYHKEMSDIQLNNKIKTDGVIFKEIKKGQVLARKGDIVTVGILEKIKLSVLKKSVSSDFLNTIFSNAIFILLILIILFYSLYKLEPEISLKLINHVFISIILIIYVTYLSFPIYLGYEKTHIFYELYVPISSFALSSLFLFSRYFSALFTILLSFIFYYISGYNNFGFIFVFGSGILSSLFIQKINKRVDLLISGIKIAIINTLICIFIITDINKTDLQISYITNNQDSSERMTEKSTLIADILYFIKNDLQTNITDVSNRVYTSYPQRQVIYPMITIKIPNIEAFRAGMQTTAQDIVVTLEIRIWARNEKEKDTIYTDVLNRLANIQFISSGSIDNEIHDFNVISSVEVDEEGKAPKSRILQCVYKFFG